MNTEDGVVVSNIMTADEWMSKRRSAHQLRVESLLRKIRENTDLPPLPKTPTVPTPEMMLRQCKLVLEETMELLEACGLDVVYSDDCELDHTLSYKTLQLEPSVNPVIDLAHIAKEASDVSVVTTGLLSECGIANVAIQEEVDAANLRKFAPGGYLDAHGKWRKPPNFKDADLKPILVAQGWDPASDNQPAQVDNT